MIDTLHEWASTIGAVLGGLLTGVLTLLVYAWRLSEHINGIEQTCKGNKAEIHEIKKQLVSSDSQSRHINNQMIRVEGKLDAVLERVAEMRNDMRGR